MANEQRRIVLSAFTSATPGHQSIGMWQLPGDRSHEYNTLRYWTDLARMLESGGFDVLFLADVVGIYDVYKQSPEAALRTGAQVPILDPTIPITAMAAVTENLGFGVTVALTYEQPYSFARRMSTLDHLTDGRIAWNVVTSYLESAARNLGLDKQIPHDERYDLADEFMTVCYRLWESSWDDDGVVRRDGVYTDPSKVRGIEHSGRYFSVPGIALSEPSPQRTPVLFQAGASSRGIEFGATHAELIFLVSLTPEAIARTTAKIRDAAAREGRGRDDIRVLAGVAVIVAETDGEAEELHREYQEAGSWEGGLVLLGGWSGLDLGSLAPGAPLESSGNNAVRGAAGLVGGDGKTWNAEDVGASLAVGGATPVIVGSPTTVADELERWLTVGDIDGFNLTSIHMPHTYQSFMDLVVPELRRRGLLGEAAGSTLRERVGFDGPRLQSPVVRAARER